MKRTILEKLRVFSCKPICKCIFNSAPEPDSSNMVGHALSHILLNFTITFSTMWKNRPLLFYAAVVSSQPYLVQSVGCGTRYLCGFLATVVQILLSSETETLINFPRTHKKMFQELHESLTSDSSRDLH